MVSNEFFSLSEYVEIDVDWSFAPDPIWALTAFPDSLASYKGAVSWKEGMEEKG